MQPRLHSWAWPKAAKQRSRVVYSILLFMRRLRLAYTVYLRLLLFGSLMDAVTYAGTTDPYGQS